MDRDEKLRVLADLTRFEALRQRLGVVPSPEEYDQADARGREIIKLQVQGHTLITRIVSQIKDSVDHHFDIRDEMLLNGILREIMALREIVPIAERGQRMVQPLADSNAERADDAASLTRQIANLYTALCAEHPEARAKDIHSDILAKLAISGRTLQTHLAEARRQGLIPARHQRSKS